MGSPKKEARTPQRLGSFWIAPFLAGSCLAIGYELTQRVIILRSQSDQTGIQIFKARKSFPGKGLTVLKLRVSDPNFILKIDKEPNSHRNIVAADENQKPASRVMQKDKMLNAFEQLKLLQATPQRKRKGSRNEILPASRRMNAKRGEDTQSIDPKDFESLFNSLPKI